MTRISSLAGLAAAGIALGVGFYQPTRTTWAALSLTLVACVVSILVSPRRWTSTPTMYMVLFAGFHVGLLLLLELGWATKGVWQSDLWLTAEAQHAASQIMLIGSAGLVVGMCTVALLKRPGKPLYCPTPERRLTIVGAVTLAAGLAGWLAIFVQVGGWRLMRGGYIEWLDSAEQVLPPLPIVLLLIMFGVVLLAAGGPSRIRLAGYVAFAIWAVLAVLIGNRSEVLVPACAVLIITARQRRIVFRWYYAAIIVALLTVGSWVRVMRVSGASTIDRGLSPLSSLAEMGASLRTIVETWKWHGQAGEPFVGWRTYWRTFGIFLPGHIPAEKDPNVFNVTMMKRVGPIGGSPVAEAYHSAGTIGAFIVLMVIGIVLMGMELWRATAFTNAIVGGVLAVLLLWVRNDFTPVIFQLAVFSVLVAVAWLIPRRKPADPPESSQTVPLAGAQ